MKKTLFSIMIILLFLNLQNSLAQGKQSLYHTIKLTPIGTYNTNIFDNKGAETVAHDPFTQRLFVTNGNDVSIDVIDIENPNIPHWIFSLELDSYGKNVTCVSVHDRLVAITLENEQEPGVVLFFTTDGRYLKKLIVGSHPDMVTFTSDGKWVIIANEGSPSDDYLIDPEGSLSIIDLRFGIKWVTQEHVRTAHFRDFNDFIKNNSKKVINPKSIRIFGPNATVAQDLEPESITTLRNMYGDWIAWVSLQENNAIAQVNINKAEVTKLIGLGFHDHMNQENAFDASNKDKKISLVPYPCFGMYQPDGIASYYFRGFPLLVMANEGDPRSYSNFDEEKRVKNITLEPDAFPNWKKLQKKQNLGQLKITTMRGDYDNDGDYDALYSFGTRSFSIRTINGKILFDSGNEFAKITAKQYPDDFNSNNDKNNSFDTRSDDRGVEPEGVVIGSIYNRTYAFIGLERIGGIMVYDITNPFQSSFVQYINTRDFTGVPEEESARDLGPEGMVFIPVYQSPIDSPLLVVAFEVSGSTTIFRVDITKQY